MREDSGFTLIELILVVLILAILAGIAIPVFLRQREKAWHTQLQSTLRNAATAQVSFANDNDDTYATTVEELMDEGLRFGATEVTFVDAGIITTGPTSYCMEAMSAHTPSIVWHHDSDVGAPREGACPP